MPLQSINAVKYILIHFLKVNIYQASKKYQLLCIALLDLFKQIWLIKKQGKHPLHIRLFPVAGLLTIFKLWTIKSINC